MGGAIIWYITMFGCAALFYGIGVYAAKLDKPMWFWSGTEVKEDEIDDIPNYNRENSLMWKAYALWYVLSGVVYTWNEAVALGSLLLSCLIGIPLLIVIYTRIYKKYKR